jgi:uncharacterized protein with PIN domain
MMQVWRKEKRRRGILVEYSHAEKQLLDYLKTHEDITMSKFCRICKIRFQQAEEILSDLIVLNVIRIRINEKGARYSLISQA